MGKKTGFWAFVAKERSRLKDLKEFQVRDILLSRIHAHLTKYSRVIFSLCALSVIIAVIDIETSYARNNILCLKILNGTMSCRLEQFTYNDIRKTCPRILLFTSFLKLSLAIISIFMNYALYQYYTGELRVMRIKRYLIRGQTGVLTSPMAVLFILECILCTIHMPPGFDASFRPEWQLIPMIRLYQVIKLLKEHNELRYHRLTNVLSSLVKITFEDTFLIKTHFLKHPAQVLLAIYFFCVFGLGYVVFVFERANMAATLKLENMVWLVVVSITNLGFGDVVPMSPGGRIFVGIASILGTLLTALMIGVMRDWLEIPPNERRILAAIKRQRFHRLKMESAARVIQCSWKYYRLRKRASVITSFNNPQYSTITRKNVSLRRGMSAINRKSCEENFQRSLMKWRKIRQYISHEFNTQMGSETNPAHKNGHNVSADSQQECAGSHNSDCDSSQTIVDVEYERQQHAIQQPAAPAYRRWAKIRKQISEQSSSPPCREFRPHESRPVLQSQKTIPAAKTSQSSFLNKSGEEKTMNLDKIESQLSLLLGAIKEEKSKMKRCHMCSTCSCLNMNINK